MLLEGVARRFLVARVVRSSGILLHGVGDRAVFLAFGSNKKIRLKINRSGQTSNTP